MIGRRAAQDAPVTPKLGVTTFGMQNQYRLDVRAGYALQPVDRFPQGHSSSEHNVGKCPRVVVVAQLAGQRHAPQTAHLISFRAFLAPGNQSIAGT